jgi:hypothetical protein
MPLGMGISSGSSSSANSLNQGPGRRTMRETEVQPKIQHYLAPKNARMAEGETQ